jgi:hypothetical protein
MARFDLSQYNTVADRIDAFWKKYPEGRIHTQIEHFAENQVVIRAEIYTRFDDDRPTTVDYAEERLDTGPMAKFGVETCATSAIGRALADLGGEFTGQKRPSREEMEKVQRHENRDWLAQAGSLDDVQQLRVLWAEAKKAGADKKTLEALVNRANELDSDRGEQS